MDKAVFFKWCADRNLSDEEIARHFRISFQTVNNWRKEPEKPLFKWVELACLALDTPEQRNLMSKQNNLTIIDFKSWQRLHGLKTLDSTAQVFGIKRQAVHNWYRRTQFPSYLILSCKGYDIEKGKTS